VSGFVTTVDRGRYTCLVEEGTKRAHVVTAMRARELGRRAVAVCHDCGRDSGFVPERDADQLAAEHRQETAADALPIVTPRVA